MLDQLTTITMLCAVAFVVAVIAAGIFASIESDIERDDRIRREAREATEAKYPHPGRENGQREFRQRWEG